ETIESNSEFKFVYRIKDVDLQRKVSIHVEKVPIDQILEYLFKDSKTSYKIMDRQVFLVRRVKAGRSTPVQLLQTEFGYKRIIPLLADTIRGTITDQSGEPLIGVNVQVQGTTKGTATDYNGEFVLENINENAILVISYIGYQSQEVPVSLDGSMNITLSEDSKTLEEVVVIGFGEKKKKGLTGSISTVGAEV